MPETREAYYPEHEKVHEIRVESQAVGGFVEWLHSKGFSIVRRNKCDLCVGAIVSKSPIEWAAEFFEIDLRKLDREKQQLLDRIRGEG